MVSIHTFLILWFIFYLFYSFTIHRCKGTMFSPYMNKVRPDYFASVMFQ